MNTVSVKLGMCDYSITYETLDDIKNHFKKESYVKIALETLSPYDDRSSGKKILVDELSLEDVAWANESCNYGGSRYLRGWKN